MYFKIFNLISAVHKTIFLFQVLKFISDLGISKISLRQEDIESILDTLIFDGKVQPKLDRHCMLTHELVQSNAVELSEF